MPILLYRRLSIGRRGPGVGLLGGGYGAVQVAITGASGCRGLDGVALLLLLCLAKIVAASLTIGSGGSAGDFAPSLAHRRPLRRRLRARGGAPARRPGDRPGRLRARRHGHFYGGIAHVPLGALVLVCELAGSYDLLVPLMLAEGIAFVALRKRTLYPAQVRPSAIRPSTATRSARRAQAIRVAELMAGSPLRELRARHTRPRDARAHRRRDLAGRVSRARLGRADGGLVTADGLRVLANEGADLPWAIAADLMRPPVSVRPQDDLRLATERIVGEGLREVPVIDDRGVVVGFLDESDVATVDLKAVASTRTRSETRGDRGLV